MHSNIPRICLVVPLIASLVLLASCKPVPKPKPSEANAQDLYQQGQAALQAGESERAAELFAQSFAREDDSNRRREAAVLLAGAGRADLGLKLCEASSDPAAGAMAAAIREFTAAPPLGQEKNPYVLPSMADAIELAGAEPALVPLASPVSFAPSTLATAVKHWQRWAALSRPVLPGDAGAAESRRMLAVWRLAQAPQAPDADLLIHSTGAADAVEVLAHLGAWPAMEAGPAEGLASVASQAGEGPAELRIGLWQGAKLADRLILRGEIAGGAFIANETNKPAVLQAMLALLADGSILPGRVLPRDDQERNQIIALAESLGLAGQLSQSGGMLTVNMPENETGSEPGEWLAELAGFVRYGEGAITSIAPTTAETQRSPQ